MDARTTLTLRCTACGALTDAKCSCGAPYEYLSPSQQAEWRREEAAELYKDGMTEQQIADKLKVSQRQISRDLEGLDIMSKPARPKGGRPKGSSGYKKGSKSERVKDQVISSKEVGRSTKDIAAEVGIGSRQTSRILKDEEIRRDAAANAEPEINRKMLSMSAQQKLSAAIRQHQRKLDNEYDQRRMTEIRDHIKRIMPTLQQEQNEASETKRFYLEFMQKQKKIMTAAEFNLVLSLLHPDSRVAASEERLLRAFQMFKPKKFALTGEKG
jgi:transposase